MTRGFGVGRGTNLDPFVTRWMGWQEAGVLSAALAARFRSSLGNLLGRLELSTLSHQGGSVVHAADHQDCPKHRCPQRKPPTTGEGVEVRCTLQPWPRSSVLIVSWWLKESFLLQKPFNRAVSPSEVDIIPCEMFCCFSMVILPKVD